MKLLFLCMWLVFEFLTWVRLVLDGKAISFHLCRHTLNSNGFLFLSRSKPYKFLGYLVALSNAQSSLSELCLLFPYPGGWGHQCSVRDIHWVAADCVPGAGGGNLEKPRHPPARSWDCGRRGRLPHEPSWHGGRPVPGLGGTAGSWLSLQLNVAVCCGLPSSSALSQRSRSVFGK